MIAARTIFRAFHNIDTTSTPSLTAARFNSSSVRRFIQHSWFAAWLLFVPALASAQDVNPAKDAKMHIGALAVTPTVALSNMGWDSNVFNQADDEAPKRDFTFTFSPGADAWLHMGPVWLNGNVKEDLVYFKEYAGERAANPYV